MQYVPVMFQCFPCQDEEKLSDGSLPRQSLLEMAAEARGVGAQTPGYCP